MKAIYAILGLLLLFLVHVNACVCPAIYKPVCTCDGKQYGNDCAAECAGETEYTDGPCERTIYIEK